MDGHLATFSVHYLPKKRLSKCQLSRRKRSQEPNIIRMDRRPDQFLVCAKMSTKVVREKRLQVLYNVMHIGAACAVDGSIRLDFNI